MVSSKDWSVRSGLYKCSHAAHLTMVCKSLSKPWPKCASETKMSSCSITGISCRSVTPFAFPASSQIKFGMPNSSTASTPRIMTLFMTGFLPLTPSTCSTRLQVLMTLGKWHVGTLQTTSSTSAHHAMPLRTTHPFPTTV